MKQIWKLILGGLSGLMLGVLLNTQAIAHAKYGPAEAQTPLEPQLNAYYIEHYKQPTYITMATDLFLVRPVMLGATLIGTGMFIISLPFTALSHSVDEAGERLVRTPGRATFKRCLGCVS